jgi:hypothetical protein
MTELLHHPEFLPSDATPTQRAEARALGAAYRKKEKGKALSAYELELIERHNSPENWKDRPPSAIMLYIAAGPQREKSTHWEFRDLAVEHCGQCRMLDLKPLESGVRMCRKRSTWQAPEDQSCQHAERAVGLEEALDRLRMAMWDAAVQRTPWSIDDDEVPF